MTGVTSLHEKYATFPPSSACEGNKNYGGGDETTQRMFLAFQWISPTMRIIGCVCECVPPWNGTGESFSFSRCCLDRTEQADSVRSCPVFLPCTVCSLVRPLWCCERAACCRRSDLIGVFRTPLGFYHLHRRYRLLSQCSPVVRVDDLDLNCV